MTDVTYRNRRAVQIENDRVRVTVLREGGHIAEILDKATGVNPLWTPPWPSIEPSTYDRAKHPEYGSDAESKLLSGLMGHNACIDLFGGVSESEAAVGMTVHGEASVNPYAMEAREGGLHAVCEMPAAGLTFERSVTLDGTKVMIRETVHNRGSWDRPVAWTQHVTIGPPFLEHGETQFRLPGTKSKTYEGDFGEVFPKGVGFDWPVAPLRNGGKLDLQTYTKASVSAGYTAHLLDPHRERAFFRAFSPKSKLLFGYEWLRTDFPWLGIWEENHARTSPPWNGKTVTRGMEFGASPMPETRRQMIERRELFGVPGYRWIPAKGSATAEYFAFVRKAESIDG